MTSPPASAELTTAVAIVRFTRRSARRYNRARTSFRDLFIDVYTSVLALGCAITIAVSFVLALRDEFAQRTTTTSGLIADPAFTLPSQALWVLLTVAALAVVVVLGRRMGPLGVGSPESTWWLPLPVDRRPMVWKPFGKRLAAVGLGGGVLYLPFTVLTELDRDVAGHLLAALTFGVLAAAALAFSAIMQVGVPSRGLVLPSLVLLAGAVATVLAPSVWVLIPATALVGLSIRFLGPRAGTVPGAELARAGAVSGHAGASLFFLDPNELLRALGDGNRTAPSRARRFYLRPARGAAAALVRADVVAFLRLHRTPTTAVAWLAACAAVMLVDGGLPVLAQLGILVVAGCAAASSFGAVARKAVLVPELNGLVPVGPIAVRSSRALMPAVVMALWMALLGALLTLLGAAGPLLILLAALAGIGMGAGSVRGATRPPTDWTLPPVETPFGPVPRAQLASLLRGIDVTMLSMMPVILSLYLGAVALPILAVQAVLSGTIFLVVAMTQTTTQA